MPDDTTSARPSVLLLAGDVREAWGAALAAAGFDVRTTGWLDGFTAARLRRPDLVLVSADLPANAPQTICSAIRSAPELKEVPVAVVGLAPEVAERDAELPSRADRYVPSPADPDALVRDVREALRVGRVPWKRRPLDRALLVLLGAAFLALCGRILVVDVLRMARGREVPAGLDEVLLFVGAGALVAALVVGLTSRRRPFTPGERRHFLGWAGFGLLLFQTSGGPERAEVKAAAGSLGLLAWAVWAWLGPRVKPRTPVAARWFRLLAALLAILAAAPWIAWAWMIAS